MASELINKFLKCNRDRRLIVHCVGDAMIDEYYDVKVSRISPECPIPIMASDSFNPHVKPGGAANVAYQLKYLNAHVELFCFVEQQIVNVANSYGLNICPFLTRLNSVSPIKKRFFDNGVQVARIDIEKHWCGLDELSIDFLTHEFHRAISKMEKPDVVILSDYDKGVFASEECRIVDFYGGITTIVDPKNKPLDRWKGCTVFKPNSKEAAQLTGYYNWEDQAKKLQQILECEAVVITFGGDKVAGIWNREIFCYQPTKTVRVESVIGAGDCFCGFFAMAIGHGFSIPESAEIGWLAGSNYVQHRMNRPITPVELSDDGIVQPEDLANRDFKLAFTNGCFDVLHEGHMRTLKFAKEKGDKLVVALNSDDSIKRLKGENRPIKNLEQRMLVMFQLSMVDFVVSFDEDTPLEVIKKIKPDALVKGSEYKIGKIVGADIVPEVYQAPMVEGLSTTRLLSGDAE